VRFLRLTVSPFAIAQTEPGFFQVSPFFTARYRVAAFGVATAPGADTDGDGLADDEETASYATDPCAPDTDGDGAPDGAEIFSGPFGTDPLDPDSDGDGHRDGADNCPATFSEETGTSGFNPDQADADGDLRGDVCDSDGDGDGVVNGSDFCPLENAEGFDADSDGCRDTLSSLIQLLGSAPLPEGARKALLGKAEDASHLLCAVGNADAAARKLGDLLDYLAAQRDKKIAPAVADQLAALVASLLAAMGSGADICT
jgi:hypothetical protein